MALFTLMLLPQGSSEARLRDSEEIHPGLRGRGSIDLPTSKRGPEMPGPGLGWVGFLSPLPEGCQGSGKVAPAPGGDSLLAPTRTLYFQFSSSHLGSTLY